MDALPDKSALAQVDEKGFISDDVRNVFFRKLRMKNENRTCFECPNRNPTWISLSYGIFLCLECSGEHRRKGVHISFVRSVELDRFSPDQIVQMAVGGNAKAWTHFKQHEMGKNSTSGRPVDYNSKIAQRYKQQMEKEMKDGCTKLGVACKSDGAVAVPPALDQIDAGAEVTGPPSPFGAAAPEPLQRGKSAPAVTAPAPVVQRSAPKPAPLGPASVVLRKSGTTPPVSPTAGPAVPGGYPQSNGNAPAAKPPVFGGSKQMSKQIDFDFDFDELELEASKPAPVVAPPVVKPTTPKSVAPVAPPVRARAATEGSGTSEVTAKFTNSKHISSEDFFGGEEQESAQARMEREGRYHKFAASGAISSNAFFGNGDDPSPQNQGNDFDMDGWKNAAKAGISKGADMFQEFLSKVRD